MNRLHIVRNHLSKPLMKVCVTGAAGKIAYSFLPQLCRGVVLGADQPIDLRLLDIPESVQAMEAVIMELEDCAFPLLVSVVATPDPKIGFKDADLVVFFGGFPRKQGMERKDLISKNTNIFKAQGEALNEVGKTTTKCVVVANPANTNCLALATYAKKIPRQNFTSLMRLDQNRAYSQIAHKIKAPVDSLNNVVVWGNHSSTQYPDVSFATHGKTSVREAVKDSHWLNTKFISDVQQRGAAVIKARKESSAFSAASATVDHIRDWCFGTGDRWVSMGVVSDGSYDIPPGIVFSFPVKCKNWQWSIVTGLSLDKFSSEKICETTRELLQEKSDGLS